jgi:hypothetical protein
MKYTLRLFSALFIISAFGCTSIKEDNGNKNPLHFFNLKAFFQKEIVRLNANKRGLTKTVENNNEKQELTFSKIDWDKELSSFLELDIERLSHKGSYKIDSLKTDSLLTITYTALDSSLSITPIILRFKNNRLANVNAIDKLSNALYNSRKELNYETNRGFKITSVQHVRFLGKTTYEVYGVFSTL